MGTNFQNEKTNRISYASSDWSMSSVLNSLSRNKVIRINPAFIAESIQYEVIMGSTAYAVASDSSDIDIYGFCIPPKDYVFPHLRGEIPGFTPPGPRFEVFQQHHVIDKNARGGKGCEYDFAIYSIVRYFKLCMENNPNMIDSLFVPPRCVLYSSRIGDMVRESRHLFLHKGAWQKFKGYAYSQMRKIHNKQPQGKRKKSVDEFGYDIKYAYHVVRLLNEVEQILIEHDLDLERNREQLKSIRNGDWTLDQIEAYFSTKERDLESAYHQSQLRYQPDVNALQQLLANCLEEHYGNLADAIVQPDEFKQALLQIEQVLHQVRHKIK